MDVQLKGSVGGQKVGPVGDLCGAGMERWAERGVVGAYVADKGIAAGTHPQLGVMAWCCPKLQKAIQLC